MDERRKVTVVVNGIEYTILGDESEEYILGIGTYIDRLIRDIDRKNTKLGETRTAVLASFHIADELNKANIKNEKLERTLKEFECIWEESKSFKLANDKLKQEKLDLTAENQRLNENIKEKEFKILELEKKVEEDSKVFENYKEEIKIAQEKIFDLEQKYLSGKRELAELIEMIEKE